MTEKILSLAFKGDRDYLHGTDIFNQTLKWIENQNGAVQDIDFAFHRLARRPLKAVWGSLAEGVESCASCAFTKGGVRQRVHLVETDQVVSGRYPYPEDELVKAMRFDTTSQTVVFRSEPPSEWPFSDMEVWVAMTKTLHCRVLSHLSGKWLFVRGRFAAYTEKSKAGAHAITLASNFNDKLTRSEVRRDGEKVGEIYFSIV